ncbi:hypothetical protein MVEN_01077500 [Mycena venus]|uniref:Uncharacterized protein n=1 Tax=Mycena venus TaxID=2733690 RepID=A0A8H6Y8S5_9AGAR|nr:hypothetical protein MVEN_01077500 [Mycena venus]
MLQHSPYTSNLGALSIMVTDSPPDDGALLMACTDLDPHFSFTSCPHSSHGFVCTTTAQSHENQDAGEPSVYPSPPPTTSQQKRNVPLPAAARYQQHHYGGILDSPVVRMKAPAHTLLSPPPTIPTPTHALPPEPHQDALTPDTQFSSLLLPIQEQHDESHSSPKPTTTTTTPQLLSPISPEWTPNRKPEDVFAVDDAGDCVLMSQSLAGTYDFDRAQFDADATDEDDILGSAVAFGRPALHPLDIPMYNKDVDALHDRDDAQPGVGVLLGFQGVIPPHLIAESTSPFEDAPPSPSSSRDFGSPTTSSESDLDDLDLDMGMVSGPSSYSPSPLRSFASLPSPDLDDLDLDMDLGPGLGMSPSPSRRSVASLPSFDDSCYDFSYETDSSSDDAGEMWEPPDSDFSMSMSPPSPRSASPPLLPIDGAFPISPRTRRPPRRPPPSILDAYTPADLTALLPPYLQQAELDALLAIRARAHVALAECTAAPPSGGGSGGGVSLALDHELRRTVPRDAGEPRRRRKRAKELGREVDALVGLALGLLPPSPAPSPASSSSPSTSSSPAALAAPDAAQQPKDKAGVGATTLRREKAGLAGLASVPQLVARMILRRRERCVRGLDSGGRARVRVGSPLRVCWSLEGDEPPPSPALSVMELDG